jgi:hypothetical protein
MLMAASITPAKSKTNHIMLVPIIALGFRENKASMKAPIKIIAGMPISSDETICSSEAIFKFLKPLRTMSPVGCTWGVDISIIFIFDGFLFKLFVKIATIATILLKNRASEHI